MNKNPNKEFELKIKSVLLKNNFNSILYDEPFLKASFLEKIITFLDVPIFYLDFDLLYSGFISAGILSKKENLHLYQFTGKLQNKLKTILEKIANEKSVVIIDSLNGFYNIFDEKDAGRQINSYIMFLTFVAQNTGSQLILTSMIRLNEESWVLSPTGRQLVTANLMTSIRLGRSNSGISVNILDKKNIT